MSRRLVLSAALFLLALVGATAAASAQTPVLGTTTTATSPAAGADAAAPATGPRDAGPASYETQPASAKAKQQPKKADVKIRLKGVRHGRVDAGDRLVAIGRIKPYVPHQVMHLRVGTKGHAVKVRKFHVTEIGHSGVGRFHVKTPKLYKPGPYRVSALHEATGAQERAFQVTRAVGVDYPNLNPGDHGTAVKLFTFLLKKQGYYVKHTSSYDSKVGLAVLAFRKVNGMSRTTNATPGIFRTLARGKGGFKLKYPNAGKHVEVDISRQVMALAAHGKAQAIFHVSTGAPATPTITGHYNVYLKRPGRLSDGMYYSSFWHGGYAIHGYPEVPTYNASHGCVRVPEVFAIWIYNWLLIGTDVYTYH